MFASLFGDTWISCAVMYGEPNSHSHPDYLRNNEHILHHLAAHVCNLCCGPRFISGDWNVEQDALPAFSILHRAGFRDLQDVALERWGLPIMATCKGRTRKDFMYISPELQELLIGVSVVHDVWPDHSILQGQFRNLTFAPPVRIWPMPHAFPWPGDFAQQVTWEVNDGDMTDGYRQLWATIEQSAVEACPHQVSSRMRGRAGRLHPKVVKNHGISPIKVGRQGDFQPEYHGPSVRHAQWVRQARRLQAYGRLAASSRTDLAIPRAESWGAILRAVGFDVSFSSWWNTCDFKTWDAPETCPLAPPDCGVANAMFDSVSIAVRHFETMLRQQNKQYAKFCRDRNPNQVFMDIRPPMVPGVDILQRPLIASVEAVDHDSGQITLDKPCDFDLTKVVACAGLPLNIIHHEADALWVDGIDSVSVGDSVSQMRHVGNLDDLEREFVQAWSARWMRHVDVPPDRWNTIIQFAQRYLPPGRFFWPTMTPADMAQIIRTKRKRTSPGLDGVSLVDLQSMPERVLRAFCRMYGDIESTGCWPEQLVKGKVVSLAKVPNPSSPADFRPITVFSILYRVWSSFHAKKALAFLDPLLPGSMFGNRPGRYAAQVWAKLLWCIENSFRDEVDLSGMAADLQKAFNMLPRLAIFEIAAHMGIPGNVLVAWAGALSQMQRHFLLRGSLTKGVLSVTGFPEGCGLSCVAMLLLDTVFHAWHVAYFPLCTPLSYVDDWQLLCPHSSLIAGAKACLDRFVDAVDLKLDGKKTYTWSVTNDGRSRLRAQGFTVVLSAKNLGAHVQMSRKHTNGSLMERIHGMSMLWPKLRLSACRYAQKTRAILVAAWPRALHAVASTTLSDATFQNLRTGAMRGLDEEGAGSNSWVHLGMAEHPLIDPQFWTLVQTVRCARDCGDHGQVATNLHLLTTAPEVLPANCISSTLLARLQTLGWHIHPKGFVSDEWGCFHLFGACMTEVILRAQWAWQKVVAQQVSHRPGFHNLHFADAGDTRSYLKTLKVEDQDLFRKCLNGRHITQDSKHYCQEGGSDLCPYCQCVDSRYHRFWECERFVTERMHVSPSTLAILPTAPEFLTGYGWSVRPYTMLQWFQCLNEVTVPLTVPMPPCSMDMHVFTDGSCLNQSHPTCRVAAYAVVLVDPAAPFVSHVIDSGPLPGVLQSSYRAEIFAVWRALCSMRLQEGDIYIWTDCNAVVRRMDRMLAGVEPKPNSSHSDLWLMIFDCLKDFRVGQITITKVAAHQSIEMACSPLEEWCFTHNSYADQAANRAQFQRPEGFWEFFAKHVQVSLACQQLSREVQKTLLLISRAVVGDMAGETVEEREELAIPASVPDDAWRPLGDFTVPPAAIRWYGDEVVRTILSWFWQILHGCSNDEVVWVAQYQLYVDFSLTGELAPTNLGGWKPGRCTPHLDLLSVTFQTRVRWFSKVLRECLCHLGRPCTQQYCRPMSNALFLHTGCIALPWPKERLQRVDSWFLMHCPEGIHRTSKAIQNLPLASKADEFARVWICSD